MNAPTATVPTITSVRRDAISREIRLELADWRTRTGGVYDLPEHEQAALMLDGHLPGWGQFLPDFIIVLGKGEPTTIKTSGGPVDTATWTDLRVHVGGIQRDHIEPAEARSLTNAIASAEWSDLDALLHGTYNTEPAPTWLLDLIRTHTPWAALLDGSRRRD